MTRRDWLSRALLGTQILILAACGGDDKSEAPAPPREVKVPGEVKAGSVGAQRTVMLAELLTQNQVTAQAIRLWNEGDFPLAPQGVRLERSRIPLPGPSSLDQLQETLSTFLTSRAAAGMAPDLVTLGWRDFPKTYASGYLQPLDRFAQQDGSNAIEQFTEEALQLGRFRNQMLVLPTVLTIGMARCLPNLFEAASHPLPDVHWTREEFVAVARQLTRDEDGDGKVDQWGFAALHRFPDWLPFMLQEGLEDVVDLNTGAVRLMEPAALRALSFWDELGRVHGVMPYGPEVTFEELSPWDSLRQWKVAILFDLLPNDELSGSRRYVPLPAGLQEVTPLILMEALGIPAVATDPELAYTTMLPLALYLGERSRIPSVTAGLQFIEKPDADHTNLYFPEDVRQRVLRALQTAKASHLASSDGMSNGLFDNLTWPLARGELSVEQAAQQAQNWLQSYLNEP